MHSGISEEHERGLRREGPWRQLLQLVTGEPVNCGLTSLGRLAWPLIIVNLRGKRPINCLNDPIIEMKMGHLFYFLR